MVKINWYSVMDEESYELLIEENAVALVLAYIKTDDTYYGVLQACRQTDVAFIEIKQIGKN